MLQQDFREPLSSDSRSFPSEAQFEQSRVLQAKVQNEEVRHEAELFAPAYRSVRPFVGVSDTESCDRKGKQNGNHEKS
jgi:hypothetical protein